MVNEVETPSDKRIILGQKVEKLATLLATFDNKSDKTDAELLVFENLAYLSLKQMGLLELWDEVASKLFPFTFKRQECRLELIAALETFRANLQAGNQKELQTASQVDPEKLAQLDLEKTHQKLNEEQTKWQSQFEKSVADHNQKIRNLLDEKGAPLTSEQKDQLAPRLREIYVISYRDQDRKKPATKNERVEFDLEASFVKSRLTELALPPQTTQVLVSIMSEGYAEAVISGWAGAPLESELPQVSSLAAVLVTDPETNAMVETLRMSLMSLPGVDETQAYTLALSSLTTTLIKHKERIAEVLEQHGLEFTDNSSSSLAIADSTRQLQTQVYQETGYTLQRNHLESLTRISDHGISRVREVALRSFDQRKPGGPTLPPGPQTRFGQFLVNRVPERFQSIFLSFWLPVERVASTITGSSVQTGGNVLTNLGRSALDGLAKPAGALLNFFVGNPLKRPTDVVVKPAKKTIWVVWAIVAVLFLLILPIFFGLDITGLFGESAFDRDTRLAFLPQNVGTGGIPGPGGVIKFHYDCPIPPPASNISVCPVESGYITQCPYQPGINPDTGRPYTHHCADAYDIGANGIPVVATHDGYVVEVENGVRINDHSPDKPYGNHVLLVGTDSSGQRFFTMYAHLLYVSLELLTPPDCNNQRLITTGTIIGYVDNTGTSTGPHLHYEYQGPGRLVLPNCGYGSCPNNPVPSDCRAQ